MCYHTSFFYKEWTLFQLFHVNLGFLVVEKGMYTHSLGRVPLVGGHSR
jgi:hypothetical protein